MKASDWTLEMFNKVVAEWRAEKKAEAERARKRAYWAAHRDELNARRRLKNAKKKVWGKSL